MTTLRLSLAAIIVCTSLYSSNPLWADSRPSYSLPVFLKTTALNIQTDLAPAPKPGSPQDVADFEEILKQQAIRSTAQCARAARVVNVRLSTLFGAPDGPLSESEVHAWSAFFEKVRIDTDYFVQETKKRWARPRPYQANSSITPCVNREVTAAYPSGHAAISRVFATLLGELVPSKAIAFQGRANQIAADRVLAGVHHPADIAAGKVLGDHVLAALKRNPAFIKQWKKLLRSREKR